MLLDALGLFDCDLGVSWTGLDARQIWLGGRDSNPDTVVQRAGARASVRFGLCSFQPVSLATPSVRFSLLCCAPVQRVSSCLTPTLGGTQETTGEAKAATTKPAA
jgi:hypothetical protein